MKYIFAFLLAFYSTPSFPQQSTYSAAEERMLHYVNNQFAFAGKYDSLEIISPTLDSCWRFLEKYPRSFARGGVFSYMFEMSSLFTSDNTKISPLVDSVLSYDQLPVTKLTIAEILIERNIDRSRGRELLRVAYPNLSIPYHRFKANLLLARFALEEGNRPAAKTFFERALLEDSTRAEGWYEYASYLKVTEQLIEFALVQKKIQAMDEQDRLNYEVHSKISPYINKMFSGYRLPDLNGSMIDFHQFLGQPVIAQCFSFWCPPKEEYPVLQKISKEFPNAKLILIDAGDKPEELKARYLNRPENQFLKNHTIVFADSLIQYELFGGTILIGTILLIDKSGHIRADYPGYNKDFEQLLRSNLRKLLSEH
jgi:thiol-disulfide isomerase/thioredoxin